MAYGVATRFAMYTVTANANTQAALELADGWVNGIPLGIAGIRDIAVTVERTQAKHGASDVVYSPLVPSMLQITIDKGCATIGVMA